MAIFDESEQQKRVAGLYQREEEELARILSAKYGVGYTDLSQSSISTDALRLIKEEDARNYEVALFHKLAKKLSEFNIKDIRNWRNNFFF